MAHYPSDPFRRDAANRDCEDEALAWVVRFSSGEASDGDRDEFARWSEDTDNAIAYGRARRLWYGLRDPLLALPDADQHTPDAVEPRGRLGAMSLPAGMSLESDRSSTRPVADRRWRRSLTAMLAAAVVAGSAHYAYVGRYDYASGPLSMTRERLPDGSIVTMIPGTAIDTVFEDGARHVALARGEAFFKVRHDAAHPFVVSAGDGVVRVLGTAFSVRRHDDGRVSIIVTEGRVKVSSGNRTAVLTPGQSIAFGAADFGPVAPVAAELATAWSRGRLVMANQPLSKVVAEINRYGDHRVVLLNDEAGRRRVNAVVELAHIDNWLAALSASQGLFRTRIGPLTVLR